ncbi:MAG: hypothetical protein MZU79_01200 [Anaerotruncus sp.]|nr:hypothetical protein [Anaerotruncus sp.]
MNQSRLLCQATMMMARKMKALRTMESASEDRSGWSRRTTSADADHPGFLAGEILVKTPADLGAATRR